jgi:hypothetical protein
VLRPAGGEPKQILDGRQAGGTEAGGEIQRSQNEVYPVYIVQTHPDEQDREKVLQPQIEVA